MDSKLLRGYNPLKKFYGGGGKREEEKGKMRKLVGSEPLWGMRGEKKMSETGGGSKLFDMVYFSGEISRL